jgi:large exoprotein involved in heme utilization and adhesion
LTEGSTALLQNFGAQTAGGITVKATETLKLTKSTADGKSPSLIRIDNLGSSQTGDLTIAAEQLSLQNGGTITSQTFVPVAGGNVVMNVAGSIVVDGFVAANPALPSGILTSTANAAKAGDITVSTGNLRILNGGNMTSFTLASGQTGKVQVNVQDLIELAGINPIVLAPSTLTTATLGSGNANSIFVNTSRLVVRDGALVGSNAPNTGSSGNVMINASQSVVVQGRTLLSINPSRIVSTAEILDPVTQAAFGFPPIPSGDSGSLTINTPLLRITDGALISVRNDGPGSAGDLQINGKSVFLDHQGNITASTASGNGGNIRLNLQEVLLMRHGSRLSATALGTGNGGNISLNVPVIVGLENSDIIANAVKGRGGNIKITTQGILGLKYRDRITSEDDITASSEYGINGNVQVNTIGINSANSLNALPTEITDSSGQIADQCGYAKSGSLVATGRGGIPQGPMKTRRTDRPWNDLRPTVTSVLIQQIPSTQPIQKIVEASTIEVDETGAIVLGTSSANAANPIGSRAATCGMGESAIAKH